MSKDNNRQSMPTIAAIVDEFREAFGDIKVTYAKENGIELGKKDEEPGLSVGDMVINEKGGKDRGGRSNSRNG